MIEIRDLFENTEKYLDNEVIVGGWVRSIRDSKTFGFVVLNDGTDFRPVQVVYSDILDNFSEISSTNIGAALIVEGTLVATPKAKQPFEIQATKIHIEGESTSDYPLRRSHAWISTDRPHHRRKRRRRQPDDGGGEGVSS